MRTTQKSRVSADGTRNSRLRSCTVDPHLPRQFQHDTLVLFHHSLQNTHQQPCLLHLDNPLSSTGAASTAKSTGHETVPDTKGVSEGDDVMCVQPESRRLWRRRGKSRG
ncbi:hypothetical protein BLNAU_20777 [Blattamonas nauphoetae]|uniref:Uncharacterized protein n=1 Tax=Blattamonas nauphoetae TaxID=2049346 RepID=A0ABQ9WXP3_9EUKA|nr:hypothetical protein BLNAU_20777 [Blattamonas nauphoetae]